MPIASLAKLKSTFQKKCKLRTASKLKRLKALRTNNERKLDLAFIKRDKNAALLNRQSAKVFGEVASSNNKYLSYVQKLAAANGEVANNQAAEMLEALIKARQQKLKDQRKKV